jgi:hypothetical protein
MFDGRRCSRDRPETLARDIRVAEGIERNSESGSIAEDVRIDKRCGARGVGIYLADKP